MNLGALLLLSLGHLVTDINQGGLPVLMPFVKDAFHLSYTAVGVVIMVANLTSSVIQPLFGYFSDRWGAIWLLPVGVLVACLGFSAVGIMPGYPWILLCVMVSGFGVASYHPEGFKAAKFFTGARRATGMALFAVGGNLGFSLGPLLVIWAYTWLGLPGTLLFAVPGLALGAILLGAMGWLSAPQTVKFADAGWQGRAPAGDGRGRWRGLTFLILTVTVRSWVQMGIVAFLPFYVLNVLGGEPALVGKVLTVFLIGGVAGTLLGAPVADRTGYKGFLVTTMGVMVPLLWIFLKLDGLAAIAVLGLVGAVLVSTFSVTIVMAQQMLPHRLGMASGLMVGFAIGTGGIAATVMGGVADRWGVVTVLQMTAFLPALGALLAALIPHPSKGKEV
jgi:FSR family fosmidomycin resistance protein-like MFS transporter